jgi:hypothetical protein
MKKLRSILALALLAAALPAFSATVAERSPLAQGTWWDPAHSGHGFEIFNAGGNVMVTWYTFDESGRPLWYTAQGPVASIGKESWPLLKHRWANGRKADFTTVGSLKVSLTSPETADLAWTIGANAGSWPIQPFALSGIVNEVDHSGTWFDPANSGWGFTLTEQGEITGGALFAYDTQGEPTWLAGFERAKGSVELFTANGACAYCPYRATTTATAGRISLDYRAEAALTLRSALNRPFASGIGVDGAQLVQLGRPASTRPADRQLASLDSDASLKTYLDAGLLNAPTLNYGSDFSPAPAAASFSFSTTNVIESGIDEADVVKTDGAIVYTFAHASAGARQPAIRMARVGADGSSIAVAGTYALASGSATPMYEAGLYLDGTTLVSVAGTQATSFVSPWAYSGSWTRGKTFVEVMDARAAPSLTTRWRAELDGHVVSSRRIGKRLYVVTRHVPFLSTFAYGSGYPPSVAANLQLLAATPLADLLPKVRVNGAEATPLVVSSATWLPPQGTRAPSADMISVVAIDLETPRIAQSLTILGATDAISVVDDAIYLAASRNPIRNTLGSLLPEPAFAVTDVHQVAIGATSMSIAGSGSTEGTLGTDPDMAMFRMGAKDGRLRIVTSSNSMWGAGAKNRLTVLEPSALSPGLLKTVSYLPNAQRPQPLGKAGELVYATRFVGDRLYAVTFRMVDPLYVVDLSNPADPMVSGALEVPGFSDYLHPLPGGYLLGFGKDATASGFYQGLQMSLYDVRDAGKPLEVQRLVMGKRGSDSALLRNHHALSVLARADGSFSFAFPARIHDGVVSPATESSFYPWQSSGLMRVELRTGGAGPRLELLPGLVIASASQGVPMNADPTATTGRSILFGGSSIFVGNGQFWRQDANAVGYGPF